MKKAILNILLLVSVSASAQLMPNSIAPNFTVTASQPLLATEGMNNNGTYTLYDYLDQGYTVFLDISTTWCSPCWDYHSAGILDEIYASHGPAGYPGVSANTTDDVMVFWIEADSTTGANELGGSGNSAGNWLEPQAGHPVQFPMVDMSGAQLAQFIPDYQLGYFPMIYKICPNRKIDETGPILVAEAYDLVGNCFVASNPVHVTVESYDALGEYCPGIDYIPVVTIQNYGMEPITNASVNVTLNGATVSTGTFSGNLNTYGFATINCSAITNPSPGLLEVSVNLLNDSNPTNNTISTSINASSAVGNSINGTVKFTTDFHGKQLSWEIKNSSGVTVASGGPFEQQNSPINVQPDVHFTLVANECYNIFLRDKYGDGFDAMQGDGLFKLQLGGEDFIVIDNWNSPDTTRAFSTSASASVTDFANTSDLMHIYPNPAADLINVQFEATEGESLISLCDLRGRLLLQKSVSDANGVCVVSLSTAHLEPGNYWVTFTNGSVATTQQLIIK